MSEIVSNKTVLADSVEKTRPHFRTYLMTDANAGGHSVAQIEAKRRIRHMKFPSLKGRHDVDSFQTDLRDPAFKVLFMCFSPSFPFLLFYAFLTLPFVHTYVVAQH